MCDKNNSYMPTGKTHINVKISVSEIRAGLKKLIRSEHSELISEMIVSNLAETEEGLSQLYLAMSGVRVQFRFKVFDEVWVKFSSLATWRMDKEKMQAADLMFKGMVKGTIVEMNPHKTLPYKVKYTYRGKDDVEGTDDYWLDESNLVRRTDNELLEEVLNGGGDDVPF